MAGITQHVADPLKGTQEYVINAGMERDGISQRVCLHPDQTIQYDEDGTVIECDYCPAAVALTTWVRTELPAWYWSVRL